MSDEKNFCILKYLGFVLATLIGAFLAFYFAVDITLERMFNPMYRMKHAEKIMNKEFKHFDKKMKHMPSLVHLVKNSDEYKLIIDLRNLDNDEKNVNVSFDKDMVTVSGGIDKSRKREESVLSFTQSYVLSDEIDISKVKKEKIRDKYIITIPIKDND
ncbi:Hsp20/alpha crystallin family protein [bacterium]|nr:Hsp20/alpha crystallin family protein [bacterium]